MKLLIKTMLLLLVTSSLFAQICVDNLNITSTFNSGEVAEFKVNEWITSTATVNANADITYQAGEYIELNGVFTADNGSRFLAHIEPDCNGSVPLQSAGSDNILNPTATSLLDETSKAAVSVDNFPNPFTGETTIEFTLTEDTPVTLIVSDATGKQLTGLLDNEQKIKGIHQVVFDGKAYPAGMYYYTIQAGDYVATNKMILMK